MSLALPHPAPWRSVSPAFALGAGGVVLAQLTLACVWLQSPAPVQDPGLKGRAVIELAEVEMVMLAAPAAPERAEDAAPPQLEAATPTAPKALETPTHVKADDAPVPPDLATARPEPQPRPDTPPPAPQTAAAPAATAGEASRSAGVEAERGLSDEDRAEIADWQKSIVLALAEAKTYPEAARAARMEGKVIVSFTLDRTGRVTERSVIEGSGHKVLDRAALALIDGMGRFPAPPEAMGDGPFPLRVPVAYSFRS